MHKSRNNLISISSLNKYSDSIYFNKNVFMKRKDSFIWSILLINNLFSIIPIFILSCVKNTHILLKMKISSTNQIYLWHICLGYINLNRTQRLVKFRTLYSLFP